MPKINTDNYDTVASWNGSQDLFVVEQPDGTKVATPAMVKQFIEAGDFTATGEIEDGHGNILADMAKADEVKGIAEAGNFVATGEVKDGHGNVLNNVSQAVTGLQSLIYFVQDLPPDASTTPANIPTGIRVCFNVSSQRAGYPMGNVLYVSIKVANTRCVQILFECNTGNPIMLRTSLTASTWSNWTTISQS